METVVKRLYEGLFLVDSALAASQWDGVQGAIQKILDRAEAEVVTMKKWDERRMAYEVKGKERGTYILTYFHCNADRIGGIERDVQLSEQILRVLMLRTDRMSQKDIERATPLELHPIEEPAAEESEATAAEPETTEAPVVAEEAAEAEPAPETEEPDKES